MPNGQHLGQWQPCVSSSEMLDSQPPLANRVGGCQSIPCTTMLHGAVTAVFLAKAICFLRILPNKATKVRPIAGSGPPEETYWSLCVFIKLLIKVSLVEN